MGSKDSKKQSDSKNRVIQKTMLDQRDIIYSVFEFIVDPTEHKSIHKEAFTCKQWMSIYFALIKNSTWKISLPTILSYYEDEIASSDNESIEMCDSEFEEVNPFKNMCPVNPLTVKLVILDDEKMELFFQGSPYKLFFSRESLLAQLFKHFPNIKMVLLIQATFFEVKQNPLPLQLKHTVQILEIIQKSNGNLGMGLTAINNERIYDFGQMEVDRSHKSAQTNNFIETLYKNSFNFVEANNELSM